jgi:signal transduction histidine kinase
LGFGTVVALLVVNNLMVVNLLGGVAADVRDLDERVLPLAGAAEEMRTQAFATVALVGSYLASGESALREGFVQRAAAFDAAARAFERLAGDARTAAAGRRARERYEELRLVGQGLLDGHDRQADLYPEVAATLQQLDEALRSRGGGEQRVAAFATGAWLANYLRTGDPRLLVRLRAARNELVTAGTGAASSLAAARAAQIDELLELSAVERDGVADLARSRDEIAALIEGDVRGRARAALSAARTSARRRVQLLQGALVVLFLAAAAIALLTSAGVGRSIVAAEEAEVVARRLAEDRAASLANLTADLARRNRDLDEFAYVASHDLKAPLRAVANLAQWVEEDAGAALDAENRQRLSLMAERCRRMDALIDGVLEYSRAGRVVAAAEPVEVARLLAEVVDLLAPPAEVRVEIGPGMPRLLAPRLLLAQVFSNLIGNAVKHAARPGLVRVTTRPAGARFHQFSVADDGRGIAPQFHEKIWGIFQTLEGPGGARGTGVGLALVKKIVEERGGKAWVDSAEGKGATFHFTWPAAP